MEFPPPDRHDRISRTCSLLPAARSNRCTGLMPSCPQQSFRAAPHKNLPPAQKYIPRQPRDHINKAPSRVPFCLEKMVRSDRLECGRKSGVKETAWWKERSVWIGKGVPDNPQKVGSAARALAAGQPKQAGLFAEKEEGWSGMRKARSRTGLFEWSAVHSDVG